MQNIAEKSLTDNNKDKGQLEHFKGRLCLRRGVKKWSQISPTFHRTHSNHSFFEEKG
jgi:hypothetical protein